MTRLLQVATYVVFGMVLCATSAQADEEKVPLDKLPKPVVDAVKTKFPGAEMKEAAKEEEKGATIYEVSIKFKDSNIDVSLTPEGKIVSIEKEIVAKDLPKPVVQTLESKYAKATYKKVEEITKDDKITYEVLLVTADKKTLEVVLDPMGKIVETEEKKGDDKD